MKIRTALSLRSFCLGILLQLLVFPAMANAVVNIGAVCTDQTEILQNSTGSRVLRNLSSYKAVGQTFQLTSNSSLDGIAIIVQSIMAGTYTLNVYEGRAAFGSPESPIATTTLTLNADFDGSENYRVYFRFNSPLSLQSGEDYYFLIDPVYDSNNLISFLINTSGSGPGRTATLSNDNTLSTSLGPGRPGLDLLYLLYSCNDPAQVAQDLPTMPYWKLALLAALIIISVVFAARRF